MAFGTNIFLFIFLPATVAGYYVLPQKFRNVFFLLASLLFYSWESTVMLPLLLASVILNYLIGIIISDYHDHLSHQKFFFALGVVLNLLPLFFYKYFNFLLSGVNKMINTDISFHSLILPIGISFFTFQGISYIAEVYRNNAICNRNFLQVAIYICAFPKIMSGPITKYTDMQCQLDKRVVTIESFSGGLERFVIGLSKKLLIADVLGNTANKIFGSFSQGMDAPTMWLGLICYTLQIYYDFSGYSDMAIGIGKLFGFTFMENFNYPYISKSITEFWRRWHISLSSWFRDYIYIPLGGSRWGNVYVNLAIVFLITGLWHGASWNFVIWGLWHGFFVIFERIVRNNDWKINVPSFVKCGATLFIVMIGWVLFRTGEISNTVAYMKMLFGFTRAEFVAFTFEFYLDRRIGFTILIACIGATPVIAKLVKSVTTRSWFSIAKTITISGLLILNIMFIINNTYSPSIYFQF